MRTIPMSIAEVMDRLTICILKSQRLPDPNDQRRFSAEVALMSSGVPWNKDGISELYGELMDVNALIWTTEDSIRTGAADKNLDLAQIGRLALKVRDLNRQRCAIKNKIVELTGEGCLECKHNYAGG